MSCLWFSLSLSLGKFIFPDCHYWLNSVCLTYKLLGGGETEFLEVELIIDYITDQDLKTQSWLAVNPLPCEPQIGSLHSAFWGSLLWQKSWLCRVMNGMYATEHSLIHSTLTTCQGWAPCCTHVISLSSLHNPVRWAVSSFYRCGWFGQRDVSKNFLQPQPWCYFSHTFYSTDVMNSTIHCYYIIKQLMIFYWLS